MNEKKQAANPLTARSYSLGRARMVVKMGAFVVIAGEREICDCFENDKPLTHQDRENARRIAACWNACIDISTDEVERMVEVGHFACLAALEKQRDAVAVALNYLLNALDAPVSARGVTVNVPEAIAEARAALAKVKP